MVDEEKVQPKNGSKLEKKNGKKSNATKIKSAPQKVEIEKNKKAKTKQIKNKIEK